MKPITAGEIARIVHGRLLCGAADELITNVQYDSRSVTDGSLFVPIRGEKVDAHRFIPECLQKGAAALTEQPVPEDTAKPCILVPDTKAALQTLAGAYRAEFPQLRVIGVTGSVGKTSTKEMIAAALSGGLCVMKTQGNKNSQIGMPCTMFEIEDRYEAAVIEMGMSEFGEMERLCSVAAPTMAVVTNIGTAHIENLKTRENIRSEKLKITGRFGPDGVLFVNGDDPMLRDLPGQLPFSVVTFGQDLRCDYHAEEIVMQGFSTCFLCCHEGIRQPYSIPAVGYHNVSNALAAIAVGEALGLTPSQLQQGLSTYQNAPMRQQIRPMNGWTLIDDTYNASPEAAMGSLDVLKTISTGASAAVLADMLELGEAGPAEHEKVGAYAGSLGVDLLLTVGPLSRCTAEGAKKAGCRQVYSFDTNAEAAECLKTLLRPGMTVLVKGSRGMHTEEIVRALSEETPAEGNAAGGNPF